MSAPSAARQRLLAKLDWQFIRGSSGIMMGITLARILGFSFSFLLARTLAPDAFGSVQYTITLATLVAILTVPFAEQVMPWFLSHYRDDAEKQVAAISSGAVLLGVLTLVSLGIATLVLALVGRLSLPVLVIFGGITLFNTYSGLGRGFLASGRLLIAYVASNALQLIAVIVALLLLGEDATVAVLLIYGLSYVLPITLLQIARPFPLRFSIRAVRWEMIREFLRYSVPVWLSHTLFTVTFALDILMIERFHGEASVGIYSLTKTIVMGFSFVSQGIAMLLMPKVAAVNQSDGRRIFYSGLALTLGVNLAALIPFALIYPWFMQTLVGAEYYLGMSFALLMAASGIIYSVHAIVTAYLLGRKLPALETTSRLIILVTMVISGSLLIPPLGALGAAWSAVISASVGVLSYPVILILWRIMRGGREKRRD